MKRMALNIMSVCIILLAMLGRAGAQPAAAEVTATCDPLTQNCVFMPVTFNQFNPLAVTTGTISGRVYNSTTNAALVGASVCYYPDLTPCAITNETGYYSFTNINPGAYNLQVALAGFQTYNRSLIEVTAGQTNTQNFYLSPHLLEAGDVRIEINWTVDGDADANLWLFSGTRIYSMNPGDCGLNACLERADEHFGPEIFFLRSAVTGTHPFIVTKNQSLWDYEVTEIGVSATIIQSNGTQITYTPPILGNASWWYPFDLVWQPGYTQYQVVEKKLICTGSPPSTSSCTPY